MCSMGSIGDGHQPGDVTRILTALADCSRGSSEDLAEAQIQELQELLHQELRRVVLGHPAADRRHHDTTSLVNELYLKLACSGVHWENRRHFFGSAAIALRRLLIDEARRRSAIKHGGDRIRVDLLPEHLQQMSHDPADLLALDEAIEALRQRDDRMTEIIHLRLFAGLAPDTIADLIGVTRRTVTRDWEAARTWLYQQMYHQP